MKRSPREWIAQAIIVLLLSLLCISVLFPFLYMLSVSLNEGADAAKGGVYLLPRQFTLYNYEIVLGNEVIRHAYLITIGRTVIGTFWPGGNSGRRIRPLLQGSSLSGHDSRLCADHDAVQRRHDPVLHPIVQSGADQ